MPTIELDNVMINYESYGSGEPLVLISDIGQDLQNWKVVSNNLSRHFRVIIFDNRCTGKSSLIKDEFSIKDMADDTILLLEYLKIKQAHILGHGMGGYVALQIAIDYPEYILKLLIEGSSTHSSHRNISLFNNLLEIRKQSGTEEIWIKELFFWLYSSKYLENSEFINSLIKSIISDPLNQKIEGFESQVRAFEKFDMRADVKNIKAETMILVGDKDILFNSDDGDMLYQGITMSTYPVYLENAGHNIHQELPKDFSHSILAFLYKYNR